MLRPERENKGQEEQKKNKIIIIKKKTANVPVPVSLVVQQERNTKGGVIKPEVKGRPLTGRDPKVCLQKIRKQDRFYEKYLLKLWVGQEAEQ